MRLQVYLSHSGACSRRNALEYIQAGRVSVNGKKILEPSFPVNLQDVVSFDGRRVSLKENIYVLLNKPKGVVTTTKDRHAPSKIIDLLPLELRHLHPVGRLDRQTSGLIVLTNDGELAFRLSHPSFEADKVYRVVLNKPLSAEDKDKLEKGVVLEGKMTSPCRIKISSFVELETIIHEGRKRQVRRMFSSLGYHVVELCRTRQGSLVLGDLKPGEWRLLKPEEVQRLYQELKHVPKTHPIRSQG
ncbi:MAG TPA: pseudouridine synthase [Candidatus Omnitrophica bacterium]|nr:pseudouridine synthase [Candidatus Omnitrophota bacterium]